jgi:DNA-binding HxlR family transcriptional regulator
MDVEHRSGCPINLTVEMLGDRWSLVILRDIILLSKRHFRELLESNEGISSNILADRLKMLVDAGMLTRAPDPSHKQRIIYSLTEKSIALVPVLAQIAIWGRHHLPVSPGPERLACMLEEGGPAYWDEIMAGLRAEHLGEPAPSEAAPDHGERMRP